MFANGDCLFIISKYQRTSHVTEYEQILAYHEIYADKKLFS